MDTMPPSEGGGTGSIPVEDTRIKVRSFSEIFSLANAKEKIVSATIEISFMLYSMCFYNAA